MVEKTLTILGMVVVLVILSSFINHSGGYDGSGGEAESQIQTVTPHYESWFQPLHGPVSDEIEGLLLTPQGSLGAAMILCILGYTKGRQRRDDQA